jgi:SAM-dependent methyltransferase
VSPLTRRGDPRSDHATHEESRLRPEVLSDLIERIFETDLPVRPGEPSLRSYYGDLRQPQLLWKYLQYHEDMLAFASFDPYGKDVLDVGSGFGVVLVWLASRGARACGLEIVPSQVDDVRTYLARLPAEIRDRVNVLQGNAAQMPYRDSSFDFVMAVESVSHYLDYEQFLVDAHRVLRPGGKLLIVDSNNGLNPRIRRQRRRIWALHERDINDPDDPWLFVPKRQRIIEENFAGLDAALVHRLALGTSGMVRGQILEAVRVFFETGDFPEAKYQLGELSVHPDDEMVMERLFNPFRLGREIRSHGFEVKVRGYWGGASGRRMLRAATRILAELSPLTLVTARSFRIIAMKR